MAEWDVVSEEPVRRAKPAAGGWDVVSENPFDGLSRAEQNLFDAPSPEVTTLEPVVVRPSADMLERAPGELGSDTLLRLRQGLNNVVGGAVEAPVGLLNLINSVHAPFTGQQPMPQPAAVRGIQESLRIGSDELGKRLSPKARAEARDFEATDGFVDSAKFLLQNPEYTVTELGAQAPQLLPALVPGGVMPKVLASGVSAAAQNAQGVREEALARGKSEDEATAAARETFNLTVPTAFLSYLVPGGRQFEKLVSGQLGQSAVRSLLGRLGLFGKATAGETVTEGGQEFLETVAQNYALGDPLTQGGGKAAALGGLLGGVTGGAAGTYEAATARAAPQPGGLGDIGPAPPDRGDTPPTNDIPLGGLAPEGDADLDALLTRNLPPEVVDVVASLPPEVVATLATELGLPPDVVDAIAPETELAPQDDTDARWRPPTAEQPAQSPAEAAGSRPAGGDLAAALQGLAAAPQELGGDVSPAAPPRAPLAPAPPVEARPVPQQESPPPDRLAADLPQMVREPLENALRNVDETLAGELSDADRTSLAERRSQIVEALGEDPSRTPIDDTPDPPLDIRYGKPRTPPSRAEMASRNAELRERYAPAELVEAAHTDEPGQAPEPATPEVVQDAVQESADNTPRSLPEARQHLLGEIDQRSASAFKAATLPAPEGRNAVDRSDMRRAQLAEAAGYVTIKVPGDGTFKVINADETLADFRSKVEKSQGFRERVKPRGPSRPALSLSDTRRAEVMSEAETVSEREEAPVVVDAPLESTETAERDLVVAHNLTAENVMHALRMGGLAVPSLAITRGDQSITGFGDITLIGDQVLADPRQGAKTFGADVYSPRYPDIIYRVDKNAVRKLNEEIGAPGATWSRDLAVRDVTEEQAFKDHMERVFGENWRYSDAEAEAARLLRESGATEHTFEGFTYSGSRRYKPHTLENVVKKLKRELRGGENWNYGVGSLRAKFTPQFRSIAQIRKEKGRIVSKEDFERVREEVDAEFFEIANALAPYSERGDSFGFSDTVIDIMGDAAKIGVPPALREYGIEDAPEFTQRDMAEFLGKLRHMPSEYFEVIQPRAVGIEEFKAAVVPSDTKPEVRAALQERGLALVEYPRGDESARRAAVQRVSQESNLLFSREQAQELSDADLSPAEREAFASQRGQGQAREVKRQAAAELSRQRGEADADANGLRDAVQAVIGGANVPVRYLRGQAGLRGFVTDGFIAQLESQQQGRLNARTAGLYITPQQSADGNPFAVVFTDVAATPVVAAWTAAHEIAGHHSLRAMLGDKLDPALSIADQNPTVKAVADSMMRQRKMASGKRMLAVEEALADLAAAVRTGDFDKIKTKHGVDVPAAMRSRLRAAIDNFLRRLRALLNRALPEGGFTDAQVRQLMDRGMAAARGDARGAADTALESTDHDSPSILESVDTEDAPSLPPSTGRLAPDDVRRTDRRERAEPGVIERAKQDVHDQLEGLRKLGKGRPKNPQSIAQRANRFRGFLFDSVVSRARSIESRNPESRSLRRLFNLVLTAPGENRLVGETMNEATERRFAQFTNRVRNVLSNEGMDRLTDAQNDQLRGALLGTVTGAPQNIQRSARRIRKLMDVMRDDLIAAGVEVGEVSDIGYLTRLYDEAKVLTDEAGFLEAAERLYKDHEFAREVGSARDMLYDPAKMVAFLGHARRAESESVRDGLRRLKEAVASYRRTSNVNNEARDIERAITSIYDLVARDYAQRSASSWLHQVKTPSAQQAFSGIGPSGAPVTKERVLSGAADTLMAEYLNTNVLDILDTYGRTTAKKLAMAERFGPKGEKVQELLDAASREGVPKHDMDDALSLMESSLGHYTPVSDFKKAAADGIQAWTYLGLLARVTFSSMAEAITFAIRTGDPVHAVAPLVQAWRAATGSQHGKDLADMALLIGVNGNKAMEEVMQNQLGGDYGMAPKWSKLIHRFMSGVMLMQLTRAQRAYGVGAATGYLRVLAKDVQAGKPEAAIYLNELGIADHQAFADWMLAQGTLPDNTEIHDADGRATPRGQDYMTAVRRIVDQTIQNPNASHRPEWMNSPLGRLLGAVMGFSYAFYENVIRRESALAASLLRDAGRGAAGKRMAQALGGAAALTVGQTVVSTIRELLFNAARFEDKDDEEIAEEMIMLGLTRTFGLGSGDPMIQYLTGLKYQRSVGETFLGAGLGTLASRIDAVAGVFTDRNSPSTDTAEYRAMEALYSGAIVPVVNAILSRSPLPALSAAAIPAVSSAQARRKFADLFFEEPDRETEADRKYRAAVKDLESVEDDVRGRLALLPDDQWKAEFEKMRAEFPELLAGVELDTYKRGSQDGRFGAGDVKRDKDGRPQLKLEPGKGQGTVLGELEGYPYWHRSGGKPKQGTTEGVQGRITALNKAIKVMRSDGATAGELAKLAGTITSKGEMPTVELVAGSSGDHLAKPLSRADRKAVVAELQELRRQEKRRAVDLVERAKRGEPIKRGEGDQANPSAILKGARNAPELETVGDWSGLKPGVREQLDKGALGVYDADENKAYVVMGLSDAETKFVAYHEVAGHHGLQGALGSDYEAVLNRARENPTVRKLADAMRAKAYHDQPNRLALTEEALSELAAARRADDYDRIKERWGVEVPESARPGMGGMLRRVVQLTKRKLSDLTGEEPQAYDDEQVYSLIEDAWKHVKD